MRRYGRSYNLLYRHVGREYILSFLVSFLFFFFIFFVNQILVLAREIILKNVSIATVLRLVVLTIPQFLLYTFPFSSLAGASMTIGSLSSDNEILAVRFSGIHVRRLFFPIVGISLIISIGALLISNTLIPYTAERYRQEYTEILRNLPTIEIDSYSVNSINGLVLSNGRVGDSVIYDLTLMDTESERSNTVTASSGSISMVDLEHFVYELSLDSPTVLSSDSWAQSDWSVASADSMKLYLDFSNRIPSVQNLSPSQMSLQMLSEKAAERNSERLRTARVDAATYIRSFQSMADSIYTLNTTGTSPVSASRIEEMYNQMSTFTGRTAVSFYYQYYRSEAYKKLALSFACTCLVFIAFPLSFVRLRYGRLIGFAVSIFVSVLYWFMLFYMQLRSVRVPFNPFILIWAPNLLFLTVGLVLILRLGRK